MVSVEQVAEAMVVRPFAIRPALAGIVTVEGIERVAVGTGTRVGLLKSLILYTTSERP